MQETIVTSDHQLLELCEQWSRYKWLGLDTEFLRVRTYYPRLCLLQVATTDEIALIDPTVGLSLEPLCRLFRDPDIIKILHAARQDIEVLYPVCRGPLSPVFDTQVAAALTGFGDQVGYAMLVAELMGVQLPKTHTRADWCRRPLAPALRKYAVDDVRYLGDIYHHLMGSLQSKGRETWCRQECALLEDPKLYVQDPAEAFSRTRIGASLPAPAQPVLKALAIWREHTAQKRNLPRNWIASDRQLADIALNRPGDESALRALEEIDDSFVRHNGRDVLALMHDMDKRGRGEIIWRRQPPLTDAQRRLCDKMMAMVRSTAKSAQIAPALLATRRDIEALARGQEHMQLLEGWRRELIGDRLLQLLETQSSSSVITTVSS